MTSIQRPLALFDDIDHIGDTPPEGLTTEQLQDYQKALAFLKSYKGSVGTFNAYRREVEKLLHWSWWVAKKILKNVRREDIESFMGFSQNPPLSWIGVKKAPRFILKNGARVPNPEWCPFLSTVSKAAYHKGKMASIKNFQLASSTVKESFAILSSFYNYLLQEDYVWVNPVALIRQKSNFFRKRQGQAKIRRLTEIQWHYLIESATLMAEANPQQHERTLFMLSALYAMYLRISELAASDRWIPTMNHFYRDHDGNWWFITVGKGNKERSIAVSDAMLEALKRWRLYQGLSSLPSPADNAALFPKIKGKGPIASTTYIREILQHCFNHACTRLKMDNFHEEAESLMEATVHWLRHTGISDDVKRRPREHVRDDAGHGSSATTDKYIDVGLRERHSTARDKPILEEE